MLNGILLSIVATIGATILGAASSSLAAMVVVQSLVLVVSVVIMLGYWKFTTPDPGQVAMEATNSARAIIRIVVPIQAGFALLHVGYTLVAHGATPGFGMLQIAGILLMLGAFVLQAIQFFGVMRYTRWLATRVPDFFIVRRTKAYMWLLPVIYVFGAIVLFLGPLFALIMYWNLLDRLRKHVKSIIATGQPANLKKRLA